MLLGRQDFGFDYRNNYSTGGVSVGASSSSSSKPGSNAVLYMSLFSAFSSAADSYYGAKVANSQQRVLAQRRGFEFQQSQIGFKSAMLQQQHNLTLQQFELSAASFAMQNQAVQMDIAAWGDKFQAAMSDMNARQSEREAQGALLEGERAIGALTLAAGQEKSNTVASQAARGITLGEGSAGEVTATLDLMKETDAMTIDINRTHASNQKRFEKVGFENEADFARVSALVNSSSANGLRREAQLNQNLSRVAANTSSQIGAMAANINTTDVPDFVTKVDSFSPGRAGLTTLLSQGTQVASNWYLTKRNIKI